MRFRKNVLGIFVFKRQHPVELHGKRDRIIAGVSLPIGLYALWIALTTAGEASSALSWVSLGLSVMAVLAAWRGFRDLAGVAVVMACAVTPWFGWFTEEPTTSASAELTWLVVMILVAGLSFTWRAFAVATLLILTISTSLLITNTGIPVSATFEVAGLQLLVASLTAVFVWLTAQYEEGLERDRAYARGVLDTMTDGVLTAGADGLIKHANPAMKALSGHSGLEGEPIATVLPGLGVSQLYADVELHFPAGDVHAAVRGERMADSDDVVWVITDLTETRRILDQAAALRSKRERDHEFAETNRQLAETRAQLVEAARLATAGELAAGIAHDVNNPLTGVISYAELLLDQLDKPEPDHATMRRMAHAMRLAGDRCTKIVQGLLHMSPDRDSKVQDVKLADVVDRALAIVGPRLERRRVELVLDIPPDLTAVGHAIQLEQVVLNLLINASHALTSGPLGRIEVLARIDGDDVVLSVSDNGLGMDDQVRSHIFDAFYTTRQKGQGTGLGLSVSRTIVEQHGGTITAISEPGEGATFVIRLPRLGQQAALNDEHAPA